MQRLYVLGCQPCSLPRAPRPGLCGPALAPNPPGRQRWAPAPGVRGAARGDLRSSRESVGSETGTPGEGAVLTVGICGVGPESGRRGARRGAGAPPRPGRFVSPGAGGGRPGVRAPAGRTGAGASTRTGPSAPPAGAPARRLRHGVRSPGSRGQHSPSAVPPAGAGPAAAGGRSRARGREQGSGPSGQAEAGWTRSPSSVPGRRVRRERDAGTQDGKRDPALLVGPGDARRDAQTTHARTGNESRAGISGIRLQQPPQRRGSLLLAASGRAGAAPPGRPERNEQRGPRGPRGPRGRRLKPPPSAAVSIPADAEKAFTSS
ncbi:Collagen Alpha-5(Vi) Chain [Manis pentadactyla]|nr:Collagen Alpha-5(Vi) Chain [Manis pentadactyla]